MREASLNQSPPLSPVHFGKTSEGNGFSQDVGGPLSSPAAVRSECFLLFSLTIPTIVVQLSSTLPPAATASFVGRRLGTESLDGFSLGIIATNVVCLAILQGLLSASDTLSAQAYGAGNKREVGLVAMRSMFLGWVVSIPLNVSAAIVMETVLVALGEDPGASALAVRWFRAYCLIMTPFYVMFQSAWKFLQAQSVMAPLVAVTVVCCVVVLPAALSVLIPTMGFVGSALAMTAFQVAQAALLILGLRWKVPHDPETWPGLGAWREALWNRQAMKIYLSLGLGGILASTEWWYWEILSGLVGTFGIVPLSVHTVPNQVIAVCFMFPLGAGIALSARLGNLISTDAVLAKRIVTWCYAVGLTAMALMAMALYVFQNSIVSFFTNDPEVVEGCERIWIYVSLFHFNLSLYGFNMGTMNGLGMQWVLGRTTLAFTWFIGLPLAYYVSVVRGGGLDALWRWAINTPYLGLNAVLCISFATADWHKIGERVKEREGRNCDESDINIGGQLPLLDKKYGSTENSIPIRGAT